MLDRQVPTFRRESDQALESLKQASSPLRGRLRQLRVRRQQRRAAMNIIFENGSAKFVVTPNTIPCPPGLDLRPGHQLQARMVRSGLCLRPAQNRRTTTPAHRASPPRASRRSLHHPPLKTHPPRQLVPRFLVCRIASSASMKVLRPISAISINLQTPRRLATHATDDQSRCGLRNARHSEGLVPMKSLIRCSPSIVVKGE